MHKNDFEPPGFPLDQKLRAMLLTIFGNREMLETDPA